MANTVGIFVADPIETGGTNALTGLRTGTRVSSGTELTPILATEVDTVYTAYMRVVDPDGLDPSKDTAEDMGIDAPTGMVACATSGGTFSSSPVDLGVPATGGNVPFYLKPTTAIADPETLDLTYGAYSGGSLVPFSFTTGTRVGQVGTVTLTAGDGQLTAEWSAVSSADGYEVQYKASSSSTWLDASDVTSPSVITGLSSDTAYDVRVRAWDERGVGAWSATASATTAWGTLIDAGFENGTTDATIGSPWSNVVQATYSTADKKVGAKSAKIVGSGTVAGGLFDASAATSMTHDTAEYRAWINPTTTNTGFSIMESTTSASLPAAADRAVSMRFSNAGNVEIYTNRSGYTGYTQNAYTAVGTYATGWMQYRIVLDFTDQTYTLSRRAAEGDSWTYLKASGASVNDIPFRGVNTISACPGIGFKSGTSTDALYVDEVRYKDGA